MSKEVKKLLEQVAFRISMGAISKEDVARYLNRYLAEQDAHFAQVAKILRQDEEREEQNA